MFPGYTKKQGQQMLKIIIKTGADGKRRIAYKQEYCVAFKALQSGE